MSARNVASKLAKALQLARISLAFGRVERATLHEDGVRRREVLDPRTAREHRLDLQLLRQARRSEGHQREGDPA